MQPSPSGVGCSFSFVVVLMAAPTDIPPAVATSYVGCSLIMSARFLPA